MKLIVALHFLLVAFVVFTASGVSQTSSSVSPKAVVTKPDNTPPNVTAPPLFTRQIKKTIAIIYTTCEGDSQLYEGTAFFVSKEDSRLGVIEVLVIW